MIVHYLQHRHTVNTSYIHFLPSDTISHYHRNYNLFAGFSIRDDLVNRTNEMNIVFSVQPNTE